MYIERAYHFGRRRAPPPVESRVSVVARAMASGMEVDTPQAAHSKMDVEGESAKPAESKSAKPDVRPWIAHSRSSDMRAPTLLAAPFRTRARRGAGEVWPLRDCGFAPPPTPPHSSLRRCTPR